MASHQCSIFSAYLILLICPVKNGGITDDSGNKVGTITEYIAAYELVVRWKKTASKNSKAEVESKQ